MIRIALISIQWLTIALAMGIGLGNSRADAGPKTVLPIHDIQGSGSISPYRGRVRTVEGIVVADFQEGLGGFCIQSPDAEADDDPATSEGLFIFTDREPVEVGDRVRIEGTVAEYYHLTEITDVTGLDVLSTGNPLPSPAQVTLPFGSTTEPERFEGMRVTFPQTLTVTGHRSLPQYGEVVLSAEGRLPRPTAVADPGSAALEVAADNALRRILLDDGRTVSDPDPIPHGRGGEPLTAENTLRAGDTVTGLTGALLYNFDAYRVHPLAPVDFSPANPRPETPSVAGGRLSVSGFNLGNYFTTVDEGGAACGPLNNSECRGADSEYELTRQRKKLIAALAALSADLVGLVEVENTPRETVADLVSGLNDREGAGAWAYLNTGVIGGSVIRAALIYRPDRLTPVGDPAILNDYVDPSFNDDKNRPVLAQTFAEADTGHLFTVAVCHLKSKDSPCDDIGDPDMGDGQGNCNRTRTAATEALARWLAEDPTGSGDPDVLIIGDFNAYPHEDPIRALIDAGYVDLPARHGGEFPIYTYGYDAAWGYLDGALASRSLAIQVTAAAPFPINADEPAILDYNAENQSAAMQASLYEPDPYRSSDHDPVVVGLAPGRGDVTGDGTVDLADVMALLRAVAGSAEDPLNGPADMDGDGYLSLADAVAILSALARF